MIKITTDNWKEVDINVDSLWIIDSRDHSGKHANVYHGNFVPQIPNQLIRRYTDENDLVLELFSGGGTTLFECEKLNRRYIGFDINDRICLNGFNNKEHFKQTIRQDIKDYYKGKNCVMLGINGKSENTKIEIDHKDGRKNDFRVSNLMQQRKEDFQPLCKAANDIKRQICKRCKETDKRWDAKNIKGNAYSFYEGDENYTEELGCKGCYQYDPVEYRKESTRKIINEATKKNCRRHNA